MQMLKEILRLEEAAALLRQCVALQREKVSVALRQDETLQPEMTTSPRQEAEAFGLAQESSPAGIERCS